MDSLGKAIERNTELTNKACEQAAMMRAALSGEIKLFKVTLDAPNWRREEDSTYAVEESDGAVIACRDRETLEKLLHSFEFDYDRYNDPANPVSRVNRVNDCREFTINWKDQTINEIEEIGIYTKPMPENIDAVVILSSEIRG